MQWPIRDVCVERMNTMANHSCVTITFDNTSLHA